MSQPGNYRLRAILIVVATVVGMCAIGVAVIESVIGGTSDAAKGRTYSDTLGDAQQKFGDGAKVVKIDVGGGGVEYEVLSSDNSVVLIRNYTTTTQQTYDANGNPATGYNNRTDDSQRAATPADVKGATVTLGQLDSGIVDKLWDQAGFPHTGSSATLEGSTWTIGSGARPFDKYTAGFDGSGFHQTQSKSDVFGGG